MANKRKIVRLKFKERRKAQRFKLSVGIIYKLKARCKDISGRGIRLATKHPLLPGDKLEILIPNAKPEIKPFEVLCRVVWTRRTKRGRFESGLSFIRVDRYEEFMQFLCEKMMDASLRHASLRQQSRKSTCRKR